MLECSALLTSISDQVTRRSHRRFPKALGSALALHAALLLFLSRASPIPLPPPSETSASIFDLVFDEEPEPVTGRGQDTEPPGGEGAVEQPPAPPKSPGVSRPSKTPRAVLAPRQAAVDKDAPVASEQAVEDVEVDAALDALMAEAFEEESAFVLPKAAARRVEVVGSAPVGSGTGLRKGQPTRGQGSGPGGVGRGEGRVVRDSFALGGPTGTFRADVCAIPRFTAALANIRECPRLLTFYTDRFNISSRSFTEGFPGIPERTEWFAIKYTGTFTVRRSAGYTFRLVSDDGSVLNIDDLPIIDNDGTHSPRSVSARVELSAGRHQLELKYFQGPGSLLALQLFVARDGKHEKTFRPEF